MVLKFQFSPIDLGLIIEKLFKISRRENMSVEMSNNKLCFVPYGTIDVHIFINSTDLSFLTPA
jgi:hypothetical protein